LINKVIWRGASHGFLGGMPELSRLNNLFSPKFLNELKGRNTYESLIEVKKPENWSQLIPRMKGVIMTLEQEFLLRQIEEQYPGKSLKDESLSQQISSQYPGLSWSGPWIDVKFVEDKHSVMHQRFKEHGLNITGRKVFSDVQRGFKYLIDFGGGGGTTWRGTITKLNMPGLLMHHETPTKDWFFDDYLKPMVNHVPIDCDLSNLKDQYDWAESHPQKAKEIAEEGTKLGKYLLSEGYITKVFNDLFLGYLRQLLIAHDEMSNNHALNWDNVKSQYEHNGFEVERFSRCDDVKCFVDGINNSPTTYTIPPERK